MPWTHLECMQGLGESQEAEEDNREMSREADLFLNKRDGQWEPQVLSKWTNRPRYTFDECNPIVDDIIGELDQMEYSIDVLPAGGQATKPVASAFSGIIRQIESLSRAPEIYNSNARIMVGTGFGAWRIVTGFRDDDSFQQDLMIRDIPNAQECVWFDPGAVKRDMSDSDMSWVLTSLTQRQYLKRWPHGSRMSVEQGLTRTAYPYKKPDEIIVGEFLYRKEKTRDLALLSNGYVVEVNEDFEKIYDELQQQQISVVRTKTRKVHIVCQKFFDGHDWLSNEKESVFEYIPIIPVYGNYRVSTENKIIYWGVVEKLMDPQRIINYSESRKVEEGALAPKGKIWMTKDQGKSNDVKATLSTLNTNSDPVQFYDAVEGQMPPQYIGSPPSNPGLIETTQTAQNFIQRTSSTFDEARGTAPPRRSGISIQHLQAKSDNPKRKWGKAMEIALTHTYNILIKAIPKVYDTAQQMRILNQDGTDDVILINQPILDQQSGQQIVLNDLRAGKYSVTCSAGPAFRTRQQETVAAITEYAQIDPSVLQFGADILLNNINAPGIDKLAARKRRQMVLQGLIPENQLTEDEKQLMEQIKSKDDMSPLDRANLMIAQAQLEDVQGRNLERTVKMELAQAKQALDQQAKQNKLILETMKSLDQQAKIQAETLKLIREATGLDIIGSKRAIQAFDKQAQELSTSILTQ